MKTKTLEIAMDKAEKLPAAAQEQLGREILERIETLDLLRSDIDKGLRELDAGLGRELDVEDVIRAARANHAR